MERRNISIVLIVGFFMTLVLADNIKLALKNFQINFLNAMEEIMEREANIFIDELLNAFSEQKEYENYEKELKEAKQTKNLESKIIFVKQLIDITSPNLETDQHFYVMRNVNFFSKMKRHLRSWEEESSSELRDIRMYRICKQFKIFQKDEEATKGSKKFRPYSSETQLVPLNEENIGHALEHLNAKENYTVKINLEEFGRQLYTQVKDEGSEIIDDYLRSVRKILQEVIDEKNENEHHSEKLTKVLNEINSILNITDFYEKHQKLHSYLENGLVEDYEQFGDTEVSKKDIIEISTKFKDKGLDLFVAFLFSNFQFLEHLHSEWRKLLPEAPISLYDEHTLRLHNIHHHYKEFKKANESDKKYDEYLKHVTSLHNKTSEANEKLDSSHIFELLHNASENLGPVTLNMIRSKCEEF